MVLYKNISGVKQNLKVSKENWVMFNVGETLDVPLDKLELKGFERVNVKVDIPKVVEVPKTQPIKAKKK